MVSRCMYMVEMQQECYMLHVLVSLRLEMIIRSAAERSNYHTYLKDTKNLLVPTTTPSSHLIPVAITRYDYSLIRGSLYRHELKAGLVCCVQWKKNIYKFDQALA